MTKRLLVHLDTDPHPSVFDTVVAYDGGADHVLSYGGITGASCGPMVEGAVFTRPPKDKRSTAIFISGTDLNAGQEVLDAVRRKFFGGFRVSVMLDSNGCNTTAAAMVAQLAKARALAGKRAVVLAGTGPVGQRAGVMLAREGAQVTLTSRRLARARDACRLMHERFGVSLDAAEVADEPSTRRALDGARIVLACGAAGVELLPESLWADHPALEMVADVNAAPPPGVGGIDARDRGVERHGKLVFGALGVGQLKLPLHRACIARLFEAHDQVLDAEEILALARTMA